jgi:hypothetical protein
MNKWYPMTPAGTVIRWLPRNTEDEAWEALLEDAAHMPYKGREGFEARGYRVVLLSANLAVKHPPHNYKFST